MHILCVAEKPNAAKQIAGILSQGRYQTRNSQNQYIKNYDFDYNLNNQNVTITMTSVIGHVMQIDFPEQFQNWRAMSPDTLFDAPIDERVKDDAVAIANNLQAEIRRADWLFIWTDCDREGEAIGYEAVGICRSVRRNISVKRARFSALQPADVHRAAQHPSELDMQKINAVKARSELDLRTGAAFTRLLTLRLRTMFFSPDERRILSYGGCQFPTLGFVVDRYLAVQNFVPEKFWKLDVRYTQETQPTLQSRHAVPNSEQSLNTTFNWKRGRLFDRRMCFVLYDKCMQNPIALVTKVTQKMTSKWKPLPLTTVEMQKKAVRALRMTSDEIMKAGYTSDVIAEGLYTKGFISYPRTETDQFDQAFNFQELIAKQTDDGSWGPYAQRLLDGAFERPRSGRNNDKAHPPIHPTGPGANLSGNDRQVYEFIARSFLAACSKDAKGSETVVEIDIADETFDTRGLVILERNYLDIYVYDKWSGSQIPNFQQDQTFMPTVFDMTESLTSPPEMLTETDLIGLMEKNEIGTDATIHEHIKTVLSRQYVYKQDRYFYPTPVGIALVLGYNDISFDLSLTKPFLRREMEADLKRICNGERSKEMVIQEILTKYRDMYARSIQEFQKMIDSFYRHVGGQGGFPHDSNGNSPPRGGPGGGPGPGGGGGGGPSFGGGGNNGFPRRPPGDSGDQKHQGDAANGNNPNCNCGAASRRMTAQKDGPNKGRVFYRCGNGQGDCGYFVWVDELRSTAVPNCDCNKPSVCRSVHKEGPNIGRYFFTCAAPMDDPTRCTFFVWEDELSNSSNRPNPPSSASATTQTPTCGCGKPSVHRRVNKDGPNNGRYFFSCAAPMDDTTRCTFFAWEDELSGHQQVPSNAPAAPGPQCSCGQPTIQRRVIKDGPNKGRMFYKCAIKFNDENSGCNFFEFQDALPSTSTQSLPMNVSPETMKTYRSVHEMATTSSTPRKTCFCGLTAVSRKISKAGSVNQGKMFYSCPQESRFSRCKYFELIEDSNVPSTAAGGSGCFHCGKPGHYASACPNARSR